VNDGLREVFCHSKGTVLSILNGDLVGVVVFYLVDAYECLATLTVADQALPEVIQAYEAGHDELGAELALEGCGAGNH